ncbi:MAG: hypothetical protein QM619_10320 [Micropruina sp.]
MTTIESGDLGDAETFGKRHYRGIGGTQIGGTHGEIAVPLAQIGHPRVVALRDFDWVKITIREGSQNAVSARRHPASRA